MCNKAKEPIIKFKISMLSSFTGLSLLMNTLPDYVVWMQLLFAFFRSNIYTNIGLLDVANLSLTPIDYYLPRYVRKSHFGNNLVIFFVREREHVEGLFRRHFDIHFMIVADMCMCAYYVISLLQKKIKTNSLGHEMHTIVQCFFPRKLASECWLFSGLFLFCPFVYPQLIQFQIL